MRELRSERAFTRIGLSAAEHDGVIPPEKLAETAEVVQRQARLARELGAGQIEIVATAAIRDARNGADLVALLTEATGLPVRVLSGDDEGRLAFAGATRTLDTEIAGTVAVVDVGGGSTEIAVGTVAGGVEWCKSFRVGSGLLADAYLRADPPRTGELRAVRHHVDAVFEDLEAPPADAALAVGGSATSLRRLAGDSLEPETFARALRVLASVPTAELAVRFDLDLERVRLLPAGISILAAVSSRLGLPLLVANGGLREGILLGLIRR